MGSASIKCKAVVFVPTTAASAPANSIFSDSGNSNAFSNQTTGGTTTAVGATSSVDAFTKLAKNTLGVTIPAFTAVCRAPDGSLVVADSNGVGTQQPLGVTLAAIANGAFGRVGLVGRNIPGAIAGLGFTIGDDVYISETAGFTTDPASFVGGNDSIVLIGIADSADNTQSVVATDLVMVRQKLVSP